LKCQKDQQRIQPSWEKKRELNRKVGLSQRLKEQVFFFPSEIFLVANQFLKALI